MREIKTPLTHSDAVYLADCAGAAYPSVVKLLMAVDVASSEQSGVKELSLAAKELIAQYLSHGGKDTHQECVEGRLCYVPESIAELKAVMAAIDPESEPMLNVVGRWHGKDAE